MSGPAGYNYRGLKATTWDLFLKQAAYWEDTLFFREMMVRYGQPALEVGCGTGRLMLSYLADGFAVDGVDNSPEMLAICRRKAERSGLRPALYRQSMTELDLPRCYRTIFVPAGSLQLVTEPALAHQAMRCFLAHLEPGGALVMRFMVLWQPGDPVQTDWRLLAEGTRPEDGTLVRWWSRANYDLEAQLKHTEDNYEVLRQGEVVEAENYTDSPEACWYTREQAVELYRAAGFEQIQVLDEPGASSDGSQESRHFAVSGVKKQ
jgi:SAM-dependent methyltransferase